MFVKQTKQNKIILKKDDRREQVTISTFGFLKNGFLQVKVNRLAFDPLIKLESIRDSVYIYYISFGFLLILMLFPLLKFAFILEKNQNRGFSSFSVRKLISLQKEYQLKM